MKNLQFIEINRVFVDIVFLHR